MIFPICVYASPGVYTNPKGASYKLKAVNTQSELDAMLSSGWHLTSQAAIAEAGDKAYIKRAKKPVKAKKKRKPSNPIDNNKKAPIAVKIDVSNNIDDSLPTREELKQKCRQLGLKFANRTSDATMLAMINQALKA